MDKAAFYILNGNNGATYIFNASGIKNICYSTRFYNAITPKAKILKFSLQLFIYIAFRFKLSIFKTRAEVAVYINKLTDISFPVNIENDCSVHIAPTRDKIIIHKHDKYFQKIAFANSYKSVKNESSIYSVLSNHSGKFCVSHFYDFLDEGQYCMFKLSNQAYDNENKNTTHKWALVLADLFSVTSGISIKVEDLVEELLLDMSNIGLSNKSIVEVLNSYRNNNVNGTIPLGLVHRDFKPWNIILKKKPLIYDFEESTENGLPLEDLLNYYIDPVILNIPILRTEKMLFDSVMVSKIEEYWSVLRITVSWKLLILVYLINRTVFWRKRDQIEKSECYKELVLLSIENNRYIL